jgi:XTP/dITP diphosphohydrolase
VTRSAPRLVLATRNTGKVREIAAIYAGLGARLSGLAEWPALGELAENGDTYAENAAGKALAVARATGLPALADDSGLEVDALGGAPGVRSRRLLDDAASDDARNAYLLKQLAGVPAPRRTARYRAVIALATPDGRVETFEGVCEGAIAKQPRGAGGFGYDPIFEIARDGRTMAEVPPEVKNEISHRARALRAARSAVARVLARQEGSAVDANSDEASPSGGKGA